MTDRDALSGDTFARLVPFFHERGPRRGGSKGVDHRLVVHAAI